MCANCSFFFHVAACHSPPPQFLKGGAGIFILFYFLGQAGCWLAFRANSKSLLPQQVLFVRNLLLLKPETNEWLCFLEQTRRIGTKLISLTWFGKYLPLKLPRTNQERWNRCVWGS